MNIIFLDIDGVLNSAQYYKTVDSRKKDWKRFDPKVVTLLIKLIEEFNAKIVISSTWRFGAISQLNDELKKSGLKKYLHKNWKTPQIYPSHRGTEIKMWLEKHSGVLNYLIFDDDVNILDDQMEHYVKTNIETGLQKEHFQKAQLIMNL
jgi:hypothetical protein